MPRLAPPVLAAALLGSCVAVPCEAQELADDAARVQAGWARVSDRTTRLAPRFLQASQTLMVRLPEHALVAGDVGCTTVGILGSRTTGFSAIVGPERVSARAAVPSSSQKSSAGALVVSRCGAARSELSELSVRLHGGRAALELIIAQGLQPPPPIETWLPERQPGPSATLADVGFTPDVEPVHLRVAEAERRMQATGARLAHRRALPPSVQGSATLDLSFEPGCHRLVLLPETGPGHPVDVDAELLDPQDRTLVRDRSNATDAVLELCVGDSTPAELVWIASNRNARVTLLHGTWSIPSGFPFEWSPRARATLAASHRKRQSPLVAAPPVWQGAGLPGRTSIPVGVDPHGCYLVGVAPSRGDLRSLTLSVSQGATHHHDTAGGGYESALVGFCARGTSLVSIEVDASGQGLHWVAGMWRTGSMPLGSADAW